MAVLKLVDMAVSQRVVNDANTRWKVLVARTSSAEPLRLCHLTFKRRGKKAYR
jgi:hypothetical protein